MVNGDAEGWSKDARCAGRRLVGTLSFVKNQTRVSRRVRSEGATEVTDRESGTRKSDRKHGKRDEQ